MIFGQEITCQFKSMIIKILNTDTTLIIYKVIGKVVVIQKLILILFVMLET